MEFNVRRMALLLAYLLSVTFCSAQQKVIRRPGIKDVQVPMSDLKPAATTTLGGSPDWLAFSENAVWVTNSKFNAVQRVNPRDASISAKIEFQAEPCSGLTYAFGSLGVPLCGKPGPLARVDSATNKIVAILPFGPADSEGGIAASDDSIWIVGDDHGTLLRIDPADNAVRQEISIPAGSFHPLYSDGAVWITANKSSVLTPVDARTGEAPFDPRWTAASFSDARCRLHLDAQSGRRQRDSRGRQNAKGHGNNFRRDSWPGWRHLFWRRNRVGHRVRCSIDGDFSGVQQSCAAVGWRGWRCDPLPSRFPLAHRLAEWTSVASGAAAAMIFTVNATRPR